MRSLEDITQFTKDNAELELPAGKPDKGMAPTNPTDGLIGYDNQSKMETYTSSDMSKEVCDELFASMGKIQLENVLSVLNANEVDVIIAAAGCPVANYPLGFANF